MDIQELSTTTRKVSHKNKILGEENMIFEVLIKSELDELFEMPGLNVRIGKENKTNPDMELWRPLVLAPGQTYLWTTENAEHEYAPFEKITLKSAFSKIPFEGDSKTKLRETVEFETKKRKDWDKLYCPYRNHKYTCLFRNLTEGTFSYYGEYIGKIEVRKGIEKRIPLSVLSPLCKFHEIEIRYHRSVDNVTGKIYPRIAKWFGVKKRSEKELAELDKDIEMALQKHKLTPVIVEPGMAVEAHLMKEKVK